MLRSSGPCSGCQLHRFEHRDSLVAVYKQPDAPCLLASAADSQCNGCWDVWVEQLLLHGVRGARESTMEKRINWDIARRQADQDALCASLEALEVPSLYR